MEAVLVVLRSLLVAGALVIVAGTALSALRTFVLPRAAYSLLSRLVFVTIRTGFDKVVRRLDTYERQDAVMALFAPVGLLALPVAWLLIIFTAYGAAYLAIDPGAGWQAALDQSGSALFTLGFRPAHGFGARLLSLTESGLGLTLIALLITYLPSIYGAFSRREAAVQKLAVRAGTPPSAVTMLARIHRIGWLDEMDGFFASWEDWFVELGETHTSLAALVFFRSPRSDQSWVTAAGCILDTAAIVSSTVDLGHRTPNADLCLRAGFLSLRSIGDYLSVPVDHDPSPGDPISITREEFITAYEQLAAAGVPVRPDPERCFADFAGWRVNYDTVLLALASVTMAPLSPWSSDRSPAFRSPLRRRSLDRPSGRLRRTRKSRNESR
ncbi:MAG: hypothetical protein ABIS47_07120 [Acidimicrobiales bacterium]